MSATIELFDRWKVAKGHASDRAALKNLGLSSGAAAHWRGGKEAAADIIERMARDLGESPAFWAARAMEGQTQGDAQRAWARIARQLGAAAAVAAVALLVGNLGENALIVQEISAISGGMPIMSSAVAALTAAVAWWMTHARQTT